MRFLVLILFSSLSLILIYSAVPVEDSAHSKLLLRQQIQLLESNAIRNILNEQKLDKRGKILTEALIEIQKVRDKAPQQLKTDEKAIVRMVQSLKSLSSQNQAQFKANR